MANLYLFPTIAARAGGAPAVLLGSCNKASQLFFTIWRAIASKQKKLPSPVASMAVKLGLYLHSGEEESVFKNVVWSQQRVW